MQSNETPETEQVVFDGVARRKLDGLLERGWKISGYSLYQDGDHGLITTGGFVGWFSVAERNDAAARADLSQRDARIEELEAAIDAEEKPHGMPWRFWSGKAQELAAKNADLEAQVSALRAALEPFAAQSRRFDEAAMDIVGELPPDDLKPHTQFTHAELRAARSAINPAKGETQ